MKKLIVTLAIVFFIVGIASAVYAAVSETIIDDETTTKLVEIKEKELETLEDYKEAYGSDTYGLTAYILNKVRIYSIPLCFIGIVVGAIYQYVLGTRRLDMKQKGFALIIAFITILVICQVLPLIFAIVVRGWRG